MRQRQNGESERGGSPRGCYVYMVVASDRSLYTGISADPERRVCEHNAGRRGAKALRGKRPVRLLRRWLCEGRSAALRLEAEIKKLRAAEKWSIALSNASDPRPGETVSEASPVNPADLPGEAGVYVLELDLHEEIAIRAGRLGLVRLGPGRLRYYGSARGPGGLRARVRRHLRVQGRRPHWHIDALTAVVPVARVMISTSGTECDLVRRDLESGLWVVAAAGFGSSDCRRCPAHLLYSGGG